MRSSCQWTVDGFSKSLSLVFSENPAHTPPLPPTSPEALLFKKIGKCYKSPAAADRYSPIGEETFMAGEHLDLSSGPQAPGDIPARESARKFLGIHFQCCRVYAAIYPNREGTAYVGNCPKCARRVRIEIGPGGADTRFFTAY
jgi:hypothetical protein